MRHVCLALWSLLAPVPALAQRDPLVLSDGSAVGLTVGVLAPGKRATVGWHVYSLNAQRAGMAFAMAVGPTGGGLVLLPSLGVAYNVAMPDATLLLKGGGSLFMEIGDQIGHVAGLQLGASLVVKVGHAVGLLVDGAVHQWFGGELPPVLNLGIGVTSLPSPAP